MSEIYELLGRSLDGNTLGQVGRQLGVDAGRAQSAIGMAVPVLLEALGRNASSDAGQSALAAALDRDHDGSILDDLGGFLEGGQADGVGGAILGHVLGGRRSAVQDNLTRATGLSGTQISRLLAILAPILLGALSRGRTRGASLGDLLGGAQRQAHQSGAGMDFVSQMLDANRDGSALDDVARIGTSLLGGLFGKK